MAIYDKSAIHIQGVTTYYSAAILLLLLIICFSLTTNRSYDRQQTSLT